MAFGLKSLRAYGIEISEPIRKRAVQIVEIEATGTVADVDLDIGDVAGTFWTAAANAPAKAAFGQVLANADHLLSLESYELRANFKPAGGAAIGAGLVKYNGTALAPEILLSAGEGLTAYTICLTYSNKNEARAVRYGV